MTEVTLTPKTSTDRWVVMFSTAAEDYRIAGRIVYQAVTLWEDFTEVMNRVLEAVSTIWENLRNYFRDLIKDIDWSKFNDLLQQVPQSFPQRKKLPRPPRKNYLKLNTLGYPARPMRCARSRC